MVNIPRIYSGVFFAIAIFLIVESIKGIVLVKGQGTKLTQAVQWIRSLFMIVAGVALIFFTLGLQDPGQARGSGILGSGPP